ncbi:hypothetical protein ABZ890_40260, partial [Streptomyces sp. NPDC046984]|uniref:hypothetical protein n=1 Tax=Streptomyces sp. NPDC046984 TaxID=3155138 RepID=UPI0033C332A1
GWWAALTVRVVRPPARERSVGVVRADVVPEAGAVPPVPCGAGLGADRERSVGALRVGVASEAR